MNEEKNDKNNDNSNSKTENVLLWKILSSVLGIILVLALSLLTYSTSKIVEMELRIVKLESKIEQGIPPGWWEREVRCDVQELKEGLQKLSNEISQLRRREGLTGISDHDERKMN